MKIYLFCVALCATFLFSNCKKGEKPIDPLSCLPANLQNGVIAFYPFSNGSLNDVINSHNLTNTTTAKPSSDRAGNAKCAFEFKNFPSGNEFLNVKNPTFLDNQTNFSISLWYMPLDTNVYSGVYQGLVTRDTSAQSGDKYGKWSLGLYDCRRAVFGSNCGIVWDNSQYLKDCEPSFYTNKWHHLVAIYNNNRVTVFRNGIISTELTSGNTLPCLFAGQDIGDLFIGKGFTGVIDDVILYNRELTLSEVKQLQNLPACCE
jgi:Concanavalin A-like lectin/glucanases superfamily